MSSSKTFKKSSAGKKRVKVEEVEEVETVDRRGKIRLTMRPVKHDQPAYKQPSPNKKSSIRKSTSPVPGGSGHHFQKPRMSKVCKISF